MTKNVKTFITASVVLNVLLIGALMGLTIKRMQGHSWEMKYENMSPESRNVIARHLQSTRNDLDDTFGKMRSARRDMTKALQAEEFDEDAYDKAAARMSKARQKMMKARNESMKEIARELPPEERAKLGAAFMKRPGHHRKALQGKPE